VILQKELLPLQLHLGIALICLSQHDLLESIEIASCFFAPLLAETCNFDDFT
jgi:hypothetical protein